MFLYVNLQLIIIVICYAMQYLGHSTQGLTASFSIVLPTAIGLDGDNTVDIGHKKNAEI